MCVCVCVCVCARVFVGTSLNDLHFYVFICMSSDIELRSTVPQTYTTNMSTLSCVSIGARCLRTFLFCITDANHPIEAQLYSEPLASRLVIHLQPLPDLC